MTACRYPYFLLWHHGTFHSHCKIQTESMRTEWFFPHFQRFQLSFNNPLYNETWQFFRNYLFLFFSSDHSSIFVGWMFHVTSIKCPFRIMLGAPPQILAVYGNVLLWFIKSLWFHIVKSLNITLVEVPSFFVGVGLGSVASSSYKYCKDISFVFL